MPFYEKNLAFHSKLNSKNIIGNYIYLLIENIIVTAELEVSVFENEKKDEPHRKHLS